MSSSPSFGHEEKQARTWREDVCKHGRFCSLEHRVTMPSILSAILSTTVQKPLAPTGPLRSTRQRKAASGDAATLRIHEAIERCPRRNLLRKVPRTRLQTAVRPTACLIDGSSSRVSSQSLSWIPLCSSYWIKRTTGTCEPLISSVAWLLLYSRRSMEDGKACAAASM
jgi:hypothetical protein